MKSSSESDILGHNPKERKEEMEDTAKKEKFIVHYSFYLTDSVEVEAKDADEAKEIVNGMLEREEIGDLLGMSLGEQKVWVD